MRINFASLLTLSLAAEVAVGSTWFGKAAYNKWHETELERWLGDHDIAYPTPADRKDLENLVKANWDTAVESPYLKWDPKRLQKYLNNQGKQVKKGTEKNQKELQKQVEASWHDTKGKGSDAYESVKDWIFDSWTESSLKAYCDKHGIPVPQPRTRDKLLKSARETFQTTANKIGETAQYPGNWIYESWSDSDLKAWLDQHGVAAPQPSTRDRLIAYVRRNSYIASKNAEAAISSLSASASSVSSSVTDSVFDAWSDSQLKEWCDKNGIKVPQGSTHNEILAIARKNIAKLSGNNVSGQASSAYVKATSTADDLVAQASGKVMGVYAEISSVVVHYYTEVLIAVGLETNYASSVSKTVSSLRKEL